MNKDESKQKSEVTPSSEVVDYYYGVTKGKFITLNILTLGFYNIYWLAKNWTFVKEQEKSEIMPNVRGFLTIVFFFQLASKILKSAERHKYPHPFSPVNLTVFYILFLVAYNTDSVFSVLGLLHFLVFIPLVNAIAFINKKSGNHSKNIRKWGGGEVAAAVIGGFIWLTLVFYTG